MPDDSLRPTPGNPPEQSHEAPPAWWGALGRADLPDDSGRSTNWLDLATTEEPRPKPARTARTWIATVAILLAVALATVAIIKLTPPADLAIATILFGVPTVLAGLATIVALHRGH